MSGLSLKLDVRIAQSDSAEPLDSMQSARPSARKLNENSWQGFGKEMALTEGKQAAMKSICSHCWTLANRVPTITLRASSKPRDMGTGFGSLRTSTRFNQFKCAACGTQWKWSLTKGWHHEGQRYAPQAVITLRLPAFDVSSALPMASAA